MLREKTVVCIGIFLVLAILTSCAFLCGAENAPTAIRNESRCVLMAQNTGADGENMFTVSPLSAAPFEI